MAAGRGETYDALHRHVAAAMHREPFQSAFRRDHAKAIGSVAAQGLI
jgi:hypothetical protein